MSKPTPINPMTQTIMTMMRLLQVKRPFTSKSRAQRYMRYHARLANRPLHLPKLSSIIDISEESGFPVVTLNPKNKIPLGVVVMFHGGAYVRLPLADHWKFADRLAQKTGWQVMVPIYPKAPNHTVQQALAMVKPLVERVLTHHHPVVFMGDSAGGGLALALTEMLVNEHQPSPAHLILMSPWLDIALRDPKCRDLESVDPILAVEGLREMGRVWKGELSEDDPRVSPLLGLSAKLPPMTLITATHEIFYPDALTLAKQAAQLGIDVDLTIGKGLFHCYPLFGVPEATAVIDSITHQLLHIEKPVT
jgi:acetyl esterase/lipase